MSGTAIGVPQTTGENPPRLVKNAKRKLTHEPKTHAQHDHDPGGPRGPPERLVRAPSTSPEGWAPPRARSVSLEGPRAHVSPAPARTS
jgi:hypothetical protein